MHWSFSLFALTELSDRMTKTTTMATAKCCQSERGLSNMIFAFGARKAINKLCVREILSLSFVCGAYFLEFRGQNLVNSGTAYNFDWGRHWQIRAGSREGTHVHCVFHACLPEIAAPKLCSYSPRASGMGN